VRILLDYRPALRERTGVGEYVHEVARALLDSAPAGESLTLFSSSYKDRLDVSALRGASVVDRRIPNRWLNLLWHRGGWPPVERLAGASFEVVHASHPLLIPSRSAARLVTIYDLDFLDHPERTAAEIRRDYPALASGHARRADHVVTISRHTAADIERRLGVPTARISICYPGSPTWPARQEEPRDGVVLFLGSLTPRKNLGALLDAYERVLARLPNAPRLVLAGGETPESRALVERARRAPLAGKVDLTGYVAPEQRLDLYRRALIFVMPSFTEGFGMPVIEAMTCGVPVVAADRGALPEAVGAAGRLVDPDDAGALAETLIALIGNADERRRMSEAGRSQAAKFRWQDTASGVREAWSRAIAARRAARG
jgi:glycosyltransferase involved in cell wall biosynthesis